MKKEHKFLVSSPRYWSLVRRYRLHERPISYLSLNQNSTCDCNCKRCFRYENRKSGIENLLTMEEYRRIISDFYYAGGLALEISGEGEPMISESAIPIMEYATSLGIWTTLITNGHHLTQEIIRHLKSLRVALVLSMSHSTKAAYENDNALPQSFDVKMKNVELMGEIFRNTKWHENGKTVYRCALHCCLESDNLVDVDTIKKLCRKLNIFFSIAPLAKTGSATLHKEIWLPKDLSKIDKVNNLGDESIIFYDEPSGRKVCGSCKYGLNIGADGNILLDAHGGYEVKIGNIRNIKIIDAIKLQHDFSKKMFSELDHFCPVRDPGWYNFVKKYS